MLIAACAAATISGQTQAVDEVLALCMLNVTDAVLRDLQERTLNQFDHFTAAIDGAGGNPEKIAGVMARLMASRGYTRYGARHVAGLHLNFCTTPAPAGVANPLQGVAEAEVQPMKETNARMEHDRAYSQIQGSKPQTLGVALSGSSAGLASRVVEKFHVWCDCGNNIESRFTKEISTPPRKWVEAQYNLVRLARMPRTGHVAALEQSELLVNGVREFFRTLRCGAISARHTRS